MLKFAVENFRNFGLRGVHLRLSAALRLYRELGFYTCTEHVPVEAKVPLTYSMMHAGELDEYCALRPDWERRYAEERLKIGGQCLLARHDGKIIGFTWAMEKGDWNEFLSREIVPLPEDIYIADTYVAPSARGSGVATALTARICRTYFEAGKKRAVAAILPYNLASIRGAEKAGFRLAWRSGYFGIGRWRKRFDRPVR